MDTHRSLVPLLLLIAACGSNDPLDVPNDSGTAVADGQVPFDGGDTVEVGPIRDGGSTGETGAGTWTEDIGPGATCGAYGEPCDSECCDGFTCVSGACAPAVFCLPESAECIEGVGGCCGGTSCVSGRCQRTLSCLGLSQACENSTSCCGSALCVDNQCEQCRPERADCSTDAECCDGFCRNGSCAQRPDPLTCGHYYLNDHCDSVNECCEDSDACLWGDQSDRVPMCCNLAFSECSHDADCCGEMECSGGRCSYALGGERCANHEDCAPGLSCLSGRCEFGECSGLNRSCGEGCCPGLECWDGACVPRLNSRICVLDGDECEFSSDCCFPSICNDGVCGDFLTCRFEGAACSRGSECCSGTCFGGSCTGGTSGGGSCSRDGEACDGFFDRCCDGSSCIDRVCGGGGGGGGAPSCGAPGASCGETTGCCGGLGCVGGRCMEAVACSTEGSDCGAGCCPGLSCNGVFCEAPTACSELGERCVSHGDCCGDSQCNGGRCEAAPTCTRAGSACSGGAECCGSSPFCVRGDCSSICAPAGVPVAASSDCCAGLVRGATGSCEPACGRNGQQCGPGLGSCCDGLACDGGRCGAPRTCKAVGQACGDPSECCGDAPYCMTGERDLNRCSPRCARELESAATRADCCPGLSYRSDLGWCYHPDRP